MALPPVEQQERWEKQRETRTRAERRKFHDISWDDGETFQYLGWLSRFAGLGTLTGDGRTPPALGKDLIWAVENILKYPRPRDGSDKQCEEHGNVTSQHSGSLDEEWVIIDPCEIA